MRPIRISRALMLIAISICPLLFSKRLEMDPSLEKNSLDHIEIETKTPVITLDSIHYQGSLFDSYLSSHKRAYSFSDTPILWDKKIPKKTIGPDYWENIDESSIDARSSEDVKRPEAELATNETELISGFVSDMVTSLRKQSEFYQIQAMFHPGKALPETANLQAYLSNSLEFRVLSKASHTNLDFSKKMKKGKKELLTSQDSLLSKQRPNSQTIASLSLPKDDIESKEINTDPIVLKTTTIAEQNVDLATPAIEFPKISSDIENIYTYRPSLESESKEIDSDHLLEIECVSLDTNHQGSDWSMDKSFADNSLLIQEDQQIIATTESESDKSFLSLIDSRTKRKNTLPQTLRKLDPTLAKTEVEINYDETFYRTKALLIAVDYDPEFPNKSIKVKHLDEMDFKNRRIEEAQVESIHLPNEIHITVANKPTKNDHAFEVSSFISITHSQTEAEGSILGINHDILAQLNAIPQRAIAVLKDVDVIEIANRSHVISAQSEISAKSNEVHLAFLNHIDTDTAHYFIPSDDRFSESSIYSESFIGRLDHDHIKNKSIDRKLLSRLNQNDYKIKSHVQEFKKHLSGHFAGLESSSLNIQSVATSEIDSSIALKEKNILHNLKPSMQQVEFDNEITTSSEVIIASKESGGTSADLIVPLAALNQSLFDDINTESTLVKAMPLLTKQNLSFLAPMGAQFDQDISLPKLSKIDQKDSFFLNPMLSLIRSGIYPLQNQIFDTSYKTNQNLRMIGYNLFNWPTLDLLNTDSYPESFVLDTKLFASDDDVYDFVCTLKTQNKEIFAPLPLHVLYVLDTSKSIEPHRFDVFKKAIITSLRSLDPDTKFNIAILDKGATTLIHETSVRASEGALSFVKRHLNKIEQNSYTSFDKLITLLIDEKHKASSEITHRSCILLSDGNLAKNIRLDRQSLDKLTNIDSGNFSLYTASVSDKNNSAMLSLLAKTNHGFSLYTKTHSSFPRKFATMLRHIKRPLLHDIHISFPDSDEKSIYLDDSISPILLADKSFSFFGSADSKEHARIFIQGKSGDRWVNILKELPLDRARKARYSLRQKLDRQKTLLSLYSFVKTKDEQHLLDAKMHSQEHDFPLPIN